MANSLDFRVKNGLTVGTNLTVTGNTSVANIISVGNSTVNSTINSTSYSGVSNTANNATFLQGYQWAAPSVIGGTTANTGNFTSLNISSGGAINLQSNVALYSDTTGNGPGDFVVKTYNVSGNFTSYSIFPANGGFVTSGQITGGGTGVYANVGVVGYSNTNAGVYGQSTTGIGVSGYAAASTGTQGQSITAIGVAGYSNSNVGVYGSSNTNTGVYGISNSYVGVLGTSNTSTGVLGTSTSGVGVDGYSTTNFAVRGTNYGSNYGGYFVSNTGWSLGAGNTSTTFFHIDNVGNLGITGAVLSNSYVSTLGGIGAIGQYNMAYGNTSSGYNVGLRNDGSSFYILSSNNAGSVTAAGSASFNNYRPFTVNLSTGAVNIAGDGSTTYIGGSAYLTQTLYDNQNTAYYVKPSVGSIFNTVGVTTLNVNNANTNYISVAGQPTVSYQGLWLGWNQSLGQGEANFICEPGSGGGGFNWQQSNATNGRTTTMSLSGGGNLNVTGSLTVGGTLTSNIVVSDNSTSMLKLISSGGINYIESGNNGFTGNAALSLTGPYAAQGSTLNINFANTVSTGTLTATSFTGAGTGLTGTASSLIAGGVATAASSTNANYDIAFLTNFTNIAYCGTIWGNPSNGTLGATTIQATGNITAYYSDRRLKDIEGIIPNALDKVSHLSGVYFTPNDLAGSFGYSDKSRQVGVIAQEVNAIMPEIISPAPFDIDKDGNSKSGENYMTVHYDKLAPLLIEAIKELKIELDKLKGQLK